MVIVIEQRPPPAPETLQIADANAPSAEPVPETQATDAKAIETEQSPPPESTSNNVETTDAPQAETTETSVTTQPPSSTSAVSDSSQEAPSDNGGVIDWLKSLLPAPAPPPPVYKSGRYSAEL